MYTWHPQGLLVAPSIYYNYQTHSFRMSYSKKDGRNHYFPNAEIISCGRIRREGSGINICLIRYFIVSSITMPLLF